jgi:hypothetical protein
VGFHVAHHEVAWMDLENYLGGSRGTHFGNNFVQLALVSNRRGFAACVAAVTGGAACTFDSAF